jgi:IS1 family transposase
MFAGLRKPTALIVIVVTLLAYGCPVQAIVHAFGLGEETVANWRDRAGLHSEKVHKDILEQGKLDMIHVQADEIRVKGRKMIAWMGLAVVVSTKLWVSGVVSQTRDSDLADYLLENVRRCSKTLCPLLICTDGWNAYPESIKKAFREKVKMTQGRGRTRLVLWPDLHIGTVIKRSSHMQVKEIIREMSHGVLEKAQDLLERSKGGTMLNTSFIERFNGTMRERLASLTRKCRHASVRLQAIHTGMYLIGSTYNFCWPHHELSTSIKNGGYGMPCTPAMASGLTDHVWSVFELLSYKVAPPPFQLPLEKRGRGRPRIRPLRDPAVPKRPYVRRLKEVPCSTTA